MQECTFTITDPSGMHARPAGLFVAAMSAFTSAITVSRVAGADEAVSDKDTADGKKLIRIMKLRLKCGQTITVRAEGADEEAAIEAAHEFLQAHL